MELVQRYHRANAYGSIITAALFIITIGEWFGGKLGIPVYAVFFVALVVLVRWFFASRSLKDSPKYLNVEYGDYCGEASNRARGYAAAALTFIMCLIIFLELWGGIFLLGSTVARLALSGFLGVYGIAYLILTADGNERDSGA
jgi:hypothetical protein